MAGSSLTMDRAVAVFMKFAQVTLQDAIEAATVSPANLIRRAEVCSHIAKGEPANLVVFKLEKEALRVETVLSRGKNSMFVTAQPHAKPRTRVRNLPRVSHYFSLMNSRASRIGFTPRICSLTLLRTFALRNRFSRYSMSSEV